MERSKSGRTRGSVNLHLYLRAASCVCRTRISTHLRVARANLLRQVVTDRLIWAIDLAKHRRELSQWCPGFSSHSRQKFDCPEVDIDKSVFNPARITELYSSPVRKGDDTETRPWRLSGVLRPKLMKIRCSNPCSASNLPLSLQKSTSRNRRKPPGTARAA